MMKRIAILFAVGGGLAWVNAQQAAGVFTTEQATAGRAVYQANCASCHLPDLAGRNEAPQLAGGNFMNTWRTRTTRDLFEFTQSTMPPTGANLGAEQYLAVTAFILQANGGQAGSQPLTPTTAQPIGVVTQGSANASSGRGGIPDGPTTTAGEPTTGRGRGATAGASPAGPAGAGRGATPANAGPVGLTVTGQVKNYVPVTDEMLRNQDPGDWLMARRNYHGWSHSPLTQITRDNVKDLQLVWTWAMNEGQGNEPSPLVHGGVIYLINVMNVVQALDARTGDLIWEHRVGPNALIGQAAMRNMAIYQDKVYVATTDARMVALDARTGAKVWDTPIADRAKGYANTAGPDGDEGRRRQRSGGMRSLRQRRLLDHRPRRVDRQDSVEVQHGPAGNRTGRRYLGKLADNLRIGGETWIAGSYDPDLDLTYWGTAQAKPWMRASRGTSNFDNVLYTSSTVALRPKDGTLAWHYQHAPGESLDLDEVFERVLVDAGDQKLVFTIGKPGILWKLDRRNGQFLGYKETVFQNVFESIDPKNGAPTYRADILEQTTGQWVDACPSTEGGHNWQSMSYMPSDRHADHPTESVVHGNERPENRVHEWVGWDRRRPPLLRDAWHRRQRRQACGLRREDDEGSVEP
jgi:alcohol dehydrogenase (cytochrome c)